MNAKSSPEQLDPTTLASTLSALDGWNPSGTDAISRSFKFANFVEAFGFMAKIALLAEKAGHHPDWSNSYNRVEISLSSHDVGGVTQKDIDLARAINALV